MDRSGTGCPRFLLLLAMLLATLPAISGCASALATAVYLVKGTNEDPEFTGLREKKVAVVCRPLVELQYRNASVARDISHQVVLRLKQNVRKIEVVDERKVAEWTDENAWDEYPEIGKAIDANLVLGIDLEEFSLYQGQTVYQGKATVSLKVYDCTTGEVVFQKRVPQVIYPPNRVVAASDVQENAFRQQFVGVLADQIGKLFYPYDRYTDFAMDSRSME
ncbi:MAG: hypothetical protein GXY83_31015 [Rhodopirellula sp.]|nr:hypothetical protein [Rhodopirellula sp.]